MRPDIAKLNFIFFCREQDVFEDSFDELCECIVTDHAYLELHTRFNVWAVEWNAHKRDPALLFGGEYLKVLDEFKGKAQTVKPEPSESRSDLMHEFFEASEKQHEVGCGVTVRGAVAAVHTGGAVPPCASRARSHSLHTIAHHTWWPHHS